jgi:hypothetical protein
MNTAPLWRLVWKDARTLLPVWLAVLGLAVTMQFACVILGLMDQLRPDMGNMLAALLGGFFPLVIATGAIQFAGESEEQTADWLRQLPVSPWWLAATKLITPLVVFVLYALAGTVTGLFVSRFRWPDERVVAALVADVPEWGIVLLSQFAFAAFFSLQMKKVVAAAALGLISAMLLMIQLSSFANPTIPIGSMPAFVWFTFALLAVDFALAVRWAKGRAVHPSLRKLLPQTVELRNVWQPLLQWSVTRRDPILRATAALAWRELRGISVFVVIWGIAGWLFINGAMMALPELNWFSVTYMLITPLLAGVVAYMNDQSRETQLFLGQRGISPSLAWITRNTLWFSAALVLVVGWSLWDRYGLHPNEEPKESATRYVHQSLFQIVDEVRVHYPAMEMRPYPPASAEDIALQASLVGSLLLGFFALGGVCGMWAGRPITAILAAFLFGLLLYFWHLLALAAAVPLWLTTWPIAILWLAATWYGAEGWLIAHSIPWRHLCAWLFAPCLLVMIALPIARRYQIPEADVSLSAIEDRWTQFNPQHAEEWEKLRNILRLKGSTVAWVEDRASAQAFIEQAHAIATMQPSGQWSLTPEQMVRVGAMSPSFMGLVTRPDAHFGRPSFGRVLRSEGKLDEEMSLYLDLLGVLDRIRPIHFSQVTWLRQEQMTLLRNIAECANQPDCDLETLQHAMEQLSMNAALGNRLGRVDHWLTIINDAREAEIVVARQLLRDEGPYFDAYGRSSPPREFNAARSQPVESPPDWLLSLRYWSGEHSRFDRLAAAILAESDPISDVRSEDVLAWLRATPWLTEEGHEREIAAELELRDRNERLSRELGTPFHPPFRDWERDLPAAHRLTLLTIALQIHRREHGELPDELSQLRDTFGAEFEIPGDPCAVQREGGEEGDFLWFSHGLDALYVVGNGYFVRKSQPLLLSVGRDRSSLRLEGPFLNPKDVGLKVANIYVDNAPSSRDVENDFVSSPWGLPQRVFRIEPGRSDVVAASIMGGRWVAGGDHVDHINSPDDLR